MATDVSHSSIGNDIMMVGLATQVITLAAFGLMSLDIFLRIRRFPGNLGRSASSLRGKKRFKGLLVAIAVSYTAIFARCVYRIVEMAGGWRNPIMQDELAFIICDGW